MEQQVAEIAGVEGAQPLLVGSVELGALAVGVGLGLAGIDVGGVQPRFFQRSISPASWRAGQRFSSRSAALISCFSRRSWSSVSRMVKLPCRPTSSAWRRSILAPIAWKVPSQGMPSTAPPEMAADPLLHLARRLVGEGDGEDLGRPGLARGDQVGEPGGQRRGLAGAGAGEDQHRPFGGQHRLALRRVEAGEIGRFGGGDGGFGHKGEVGGRERNGNRVKTSRRGCAGVPGSYLRPRLARMGGVPARELGLTPDIPVIHRHEPSFSAWRDSDSLCRYQFVIGTEVPASPEGRQRQDGAASDGRTDLRRQAME